MDATDNKDVKAKMTFHKVNIPKNCKVTLTQTISTKPNKRGK